MAIVAVILTFVAQLPTVNNTVILPYTTWIAGISATTIQLSGVEAHAEGTQLLGEHFAVEIRRGCDGVEATILLVAACLAYPMPWRDRILGTALGYLLIFVLNLVRIIVLFRLGDAGYERAFEFFHVYIAQFAVITAVMVFWIYWIRFRAQRSPG